MLISQPGHESGLEQLKQELESRGLFDAVLYPEGYVACGQGVAELCRLARRYKKLMITSYKDSNNKDRALIINSSGEIILERAKSPMNEKLYSPSIVGTDGLTIGYLLCVELLQGLDGLEGLKGFDFIAHPIGVGMFSDEQFAEWIAEAMKIALKYNTAIMGTSHADGSYRNCGVSIPISYYIDSRGEAGYISRNDTRSRIVDLETGAVEFLDQKVPG